MTGHGGNIHKASQISGLPLKQILDFSASINPLGLPKTAIAAIRKAISLLPHYPEPFADSLASRIALHYSLPPESLICGNGSTELIYLIPRVLKPKRILVAAPTFSEYERACKSIQKSEVRKLKLRPESRFDINPEAFIKSMHGCDLAFLCNPNNPTGRLIKRKDVLKIADAAREFGCYLAVDEAFMDFCPDETVMKYVSRNPYLIVLRSLTKFYALAGLRIGFGVFPLPFAQRMKIQKEPWTINCLADAAGRAVLNDTGYRSRSLEMMHGEKQFLEAGLERLGINHIRSVANYYLLEMKYAQKVIRDLSKKGILLRDCSNFDGLAETYMRIAVRSRKENKILLKELSKLCQAS
ncbi:MAG: threonine-phosphate decarboxylase [Nitrospirae bacterium]|nr:threonine-phosphate decarboxylase [Nitrospirota bacterium]